MQDTDFPKATFKEHYSELRTRLMLCVLTVIIFTSICFAFSELILDFLIKPLFEALALDDEKRSRKLIFTGLTEGFFAHMKVSFYFGFALSLPFTVSQIYFFIAPGLYKKEKKLVLPYVIFVPILFTLGAAIVYWFIMPIAWKFFLGFQSVGTSETLPIVLEARISEYIDLVTTLIIGFGVAFQLPVILSFLSYTSLVKSETLISKRKYAIVLIFFAAALLTPPDVISQIILAIPLLFLYEISIFICKRIEKSSNKNA